MRRKIIMLVLVAMVSMFTVQNVIIHSVNARYKDAVSVPNSKVPHYYIYYDEARNYFGPAFLSGNKGGSVIDLSSVREKEPGIYIALISQWWYKDDYIEPNGYFYIRTLDEKNKKYQYGFSKTTYGPDRWFDLSHVYDLDVQLIIKKAKENGSANTNSQPTQPKIDPLTVDLMKCWQEDVDASSGADQKILSIYPGMSEDEFYNNFSNWSRVVDYVEGSFTQYHMERGNEYLKEKLSYCKYNNELIFNGGISFETNQRAVGHQIFERFRKNLSALYKEQILNHDGTQLLYSTSDLTLAGHLTIFTDYKKDYYRVTWTGMSLTD